MNFSRTVMFIGLLAMSPVSQADGTSEGSTSPQTTTTTTATTKAVSTKTQSPLNNNSPTTGNSTTAAASTKTNTLNMTTNATITTATPKVTSLPTNLTISTLSSTITTDMSTTTATTSMSIVTTTQSPCESKLCINGTNQTTTNMSTTTATTLTSTSKSPCESKLCINGTCDVENATGICTCNPGYNGSFCDTEITNPTSQTSSTTTTITDMSTTKATTPTIIDTTTHSPCESKPCNNGTCDVMNGTAVCTCIPGYTGVDCETDIDECNTTNNCSKDANCINTGGSYTCKCTAGWTGDGRTCSDINECDESPCHVWANCSNTDGSYRCKCKTGFTGNGSVCEDKNECSNSTANNCSVNANCTNTNGSYTCGCKTGWTGNGQECTDIDECLEKPCHVWANCTNTDGSYNCSCQSGFTGNGTHCVDIDECNGNNSCHENNTRECVNLAQNYFCICKLGWKGDFCNEDDNLCDAKRNPCSPNANCSYDETGPHCTCKDQFKGNGTTCFQKVLIETYQYTNKEVGDDNILGPYDVDGGIPYNGQMYFRIYVSMNGYLTLGQRLNRKYPDIEGLISEVSVPIIAPLWADIETKDETGLNVNSTVDPVEINEYFENRLANPRFAFVATWIGAVPYPYEENKNSERADFQVVLITNGSETRVMFNYNQENFTWHISPGRKVAVGLTNNKDWRLIANSDNFTNMNKFTNENDSDLKGRYIGEVLNNNPNLQFETECYNWTKSDELDKLSKELSDADYCPCSQAQADRDRRFKNVGGNVYRSRFAREPYGSKQTCKYSSNGALMTGVPNGGYLDISSESLSTTDGHTKCCERSTRLCNRFYEIVPSQNCFGYTPPSWSLTWGDPHLQTIDGQTYTFNGRGEYTLLEYLATNGSENIEIQVRTDFVNENQTDATVFVGLAVKVGHGSILELNLNRTSNSSILYIDGIYNTTFDGTKSVEINVDDTQIFNDSSDLIILTRQGIAVKVDVSNILDITTSVPREKSFIGNTRGLLGNNDQNDTNDYVSRNGTESYPTNANESTIYEFASSWRVSQKASLFNYTNKGKPYEYYNNISSKPVFISELELENITDYMIEKCGETFNLSFCNNESECITDTVATCDPGIGMRTMKSVKNAKREVTILGNDPPRLTSAAVPTIYLGFKFNDSWSQNLSLFFTDDNVITISKNVSLEGFHTLENNTFSLNVSTLPRNQTDQLYIKFIATDTFNASTEFWPNIYYCGCEREQECDYSTATQSIEDRFYVASCNCPDDYIGDYCEIKNCNCYNVTNWSTCKCGCPTGMQQVNDGQKCYDVDECSQGICTQMCVNTIGSYNCSCTDGYYLGKDGKSCVDEDECQEDASLCQDAGQYCSNIPGNYSCECLPGYVDRGNQDNDTRCIKVSQSFAGILIIDVTLINSSNTIQDVAKTLVEQIFHGLENIIVDVEVTEKVDRRKKRGYGDNLNTTKYTCSFVLYTTASINETEVVDALIEYQQIYHNSARSIGGSLVQMYPEDSKIYIDTENGICNVPGKTDCDSISTNCVTSNGVFSCQCKDGFERLPMSQKRCNDINECTENTTICQHGNCTNTPGSFYCTCKPGYKLQGTVCQDTCQSNPCKNDGQCTHGTLEGQYICKCDDKWTGATCETENSEISKLRTIAIAVGATVGCVCILLLIAMFGMYRRHQKRKFPYSRRPLSAMEDFDKCLSDTNLRYHKDMPIDDGDTYDNGTTFDMPRIPRAKLRESGYNSIEGQSEQEGADRSVSGQTQPGTMQDNDENRPLASVKRHSADSDKFGKSNPSFLHNEYEERASTRKGENQYEYF